LPLPAAVLNDEATVTDATTDAALTGGGIDYQYGTMVRTKLGGGSGGTVDLSSYATKHTLILK
jgi:CO dehydrogenase/acetyl-CoA synthase delta subunit